MQLIDFTCSNRKIAQGACILCVIVSAAARAALMHFGNRFGLDDLSYSFPLARLPYVILGMWISAVLNIKQNIKDVSHRVAWEEIVSPVVVLSWFLLRNSCELSVFVLVCIDLTICGSLIYFFAQEKSIIFQKMASGIFAKLGGSMMYVYLFHYPVLNYIDLIFKEHRYVFGNVTGIVETIIITFLTVVW